MPKNNNAGMSYKNKRKINPDSLPEDFKPSAKDVDIWDVLEERKRKGLWDGEIDRITVTEYDLTKGTHYYEITDARKREVTCNLCPIRHGGVLEAHMLSRYEVKNGIIYLDKMPRTRAPERKRIDKRRRKKLQ
jgi:hypothetical protein